MKTDKNNELIFEDRFAKKMNDLLEKYYKERLSMSIKRGIAHKKNKEKSDLQCKEK